MFFSFWVAFANSATSAECANKVRFFRLESVKEKQGILSETIKAPPQGGGVALATSITKNCTPVMAAWILRNPNRGIAVHLTFDFLRDTQ